LSLLPPEQLSDRLAALPSKPGVYLMRDAGGRVIYVGKAVRLRDRVRSYFHSTEGQSRKLRRLVRSIADFEVIVTASELEALILECNLIKKHRPHFNVRLKDDKRYPYIKISVQEDYPRIYTVRRIQEDGARYFGPYTSSKAVRQTLELLRKLFPYHTCKREITGKDARPCLYYHIGRCAGPCIGAVSRQDYRALVGQVALFLEGRQEQIMLDLERRMQEAAQALDFELAATLRDQVQALQQVIEKQRIVSAAGKDEDVIAFAREDGQACVQAFFIRAGQLVGREYFVLTGTQDEESREIMTSFVKQFYDKAASVPSTILLQHSIDEALVIENWLRQKRGGTKVAVRVPRRGRGRELVDMVAENAEETLAQLRAEWAADEARQVAALEELQQCLGLEHAPTRIECYDISNIQGQSATGSMVVFAKGVPRKSEYRHFRIKSVNGADDLAMLQEVLRRRFKHATVREAVHVGATPEDEQDGQSGWRILPDLVIVDGGKGQVGAARAVLAEQGLAQMPLVGLAKKREEVFLPGQSRPVLLPRDSEALYMLQRIRDEAHRFAIGYHRRLRRKANVESLLDGVSGIGPKRRQALLRHFGSIAAIREADVAQLAAVEGMTDAVARQLKEQL